MATTRAKALMRSGIDDRIAAAGQTLAARFGVEVPASGPVSKDADLAVLAERERLAALLEAVCAATAPDAEPVDLAAMSRDDLDVRAADYGIDPKQYRKKDDLIAALEAAGKEPTVPTKDAAPEGEETFDYVNDAGERRTETQQWFDTEGRAAGFRPATEGEGEPAAMPPAKPGE